MTTTESTETVGSGIMTAEEVAQYLRFDKATIYKLAQAGEIPAVKVGRTWRFRKKLIDEWFRDESMQRLCEKDRDDSQNSLELSEDQGADDQNVA